MTKDLTTIETAFLIIYLSCKFKLSLNFKKIKELTEDITQKNYLDIRKGTDGINASEVKNIIRKWLSEVADYDIKKDENISFSLKTD